MILTKNVLARAHKKFQSGQHSEIHLPTLNEQDKTKMELPLGMVSKHAFWYLSAGLFIYISTKKLILLSPYFRDLVRLLTFTVDLFAKYKLYERIHACGNH